MRLFINSLSKTEDNIPHRNVILFTGQSNARGQAPNSSLPTELRKVWDTNMWYSAGNTWTKLDTTTDSTFGAEVRISELYKNYFGDDPYIVRFAVPSTAILEHLPSGSVYDVFYPDYVQTALQSIIDEGLQPRVWLFWIQGEQDSNDNGLTAIYRSQFDTWIAQWQSNLGGTVPINAVEIVSTVNTNCPLINNDFHEASLITGNNLRVVDTEGLTTVDGLHYDYEAFNSIGDALMNNIKIQPPLRIDNI